MSNDHMVDDAVRYIAQNKHFTITKDSNTELLEKLEYGSCHSGYNSNCSNDYNCSYRLTNNKELRHQSKTIWALDNPPKPKM